MVLSDANFVEPAMGCYARAVDAFEEPGGYLVRVGQAYRRGYTAVADVHVRIGVVSPRRHGQPVRSSSTHGPGSFVLSP
jgi:hypothetical protein